MNPGYTERTALLVGQEALEKLANSFVAVAGLGGVGGHCAEALARTGVGRLLLLDCDTVQSSNLNRQLVAAKSTLGQKKTDVMQRRIQDVSDCLVETLDVFITPENVDALLPEGLDFVVDAIDTLSGKLALCRWAKAHAKPIVSCMGAGNRLDPSALLVKDVFSTAGCPLARRMRQALRREGITALPVVVSGEAPHTAAGQRTVGSFSPVTGAAGLVAAGYVLRELMKTDEHRRPRPEEP